MDPITAISEITSLLGNASELVGNLRAARKNGAGKALAVAVPVAVPVATNAAFQEHLSKMVSELVKSKDIDANGTLSAVELGSDKALFDRIDLNHDGQLDGAELAQAIASNKLVPCEFRAPAV